MDIVLLAGMWLDADVWQDVLPPLVAAGHRPVPVPLPGQGDGNRMATLDDQLDAVLAAVDGSAGPVMVVGHSGACTLAWLTADRRPDRVARVVMVGGMPNAEAEPYFAVFEPVDGVVSFPGWEPFAGPDSDDLSDEQKAAMAAGAHPVPEGVARATVHYTDPRRRHVPVLMVCPEYSPEDARAWLEGGHIPELADAADVTYADIDSGHWPMVSRPAELASLLAQAADGGR